MPIPAEARFWIARALGLWRRGLSSLRSRGMAASWQRVKLQFRRGGDASPSLYSPDAAPFAPFTLATSNTPRASIVIPVHGAVRAYPGLPARPRRAPAASRHRSDRGRRCLAAMIRASGCCRSTASACTRARPTAASSPPATTARRWRAATTWSSSTTTPCRSPAGWTRCCARSTTIPTPAWSARSWSIPMAACRRPAAWCSRTASAWNYGRFEDPTDCRFAYVRDADYLSGAAIAIPRALFQRLGGFDARYAPAYYEDTDLAFAVRAAGLRVLYQPRAVVVHDEGTTAGTDIGSGAKAGAGAQPTGVLRTMARCTGRGNSRPAASRRRHCCTADNARCWSSTP